MCSSFFQFTNMNLYIVGSELILPNSIPYIWNFQFAGLNTLNLPGEGPIELDSILKPSGIEEIGVNAFGENEKVTIKCACGAEFETRSTKKDIRLDICSKCHPFFTGKQKLVDTGGRVDRFKKRFGMDK